MPVHSTLSAAAFAAVLASVSVVKGQSTFPATPLASKHFAYPTGIPYKADTDTGLIRGTQFGYNLCNSTTEGASSLCQTSFVNALDDFCLWGPSQPNSAISDTEGEEVAWCTKPGRGTRLMPAGTLTGAQLIKTPDYVQIVGFMDQTKINIADGDFGGELDPHGADLRGNPMGGLMYSTAFGDGKSYTQVIEWTNFVGGNGFCIKVCDPAGPRAATLCEHRLDRIGCNYNMPNAAQNNVFESCEGESQDPPGVYVENGQTMSYQQPGEGTAANPTYTPRIPSSSNCQQFTSSTLYAAIASVTAAGGSSASGSGSVTTTASGGSQTGAATSGTSKTSGSNTSSGAKPTTSSNDAVVATVSLAGLLGIAFSAIFMA